MSISFNLSKFGQFDFSLKFYENGSLISNVQCIFTLQVLGKGSYKKLNLYN